MRTAAAVLALAAGWAAAGWADERPSETDLFGTAAASTTVAAVSTTALTAPEPPARHEIAPDNPLAIGGLLYLREAGTVSRTRAVGDAALTTPILADFYGDARPNDRVRAMIRARMNYDPSINPSATSFMNPVPYGGPSVALDQAWVNFDIHHTAFVTVGRQHVKWGVARFWNPNDLLHTTRRDALAQFDARTGETLVKVHVPWEARGWNVYAIQLLESLDHAATVGRVGGAGRIEAVFGPAELGLDALAQRGFKPRAGADLSSGLGPIDVYAEGVIQRGTDRPLWREVVNPPPFAVGTILETYTPDKLVGSAAGGLTWSFKITDQDAMTLGAEYFYNAAGYTKKSIYPWLMFEGSFAPFYVARDYAGAYAYCTVPGTNGNQTITLSNIANLSDRTGVVRLDWTMLALTHLQVETYVAGLYGQSGGEFRFGLDTGPQVINGIPIPALHLPAPLAQAGAALRVNF